MLVIFRAGPNGDQTLDVIDVIPRAKQHTIKARGLGRKAQEFFWVDADDTVLSDDEFNGLAKQVTAPETEEIEPTIGPKGPIPRSRILAKRKYRLDQKELEKIDKSFKASSASRSRDAAKFYPKKRLTITQLKAIIKDKKTGRFIDGH